jgi:hypothetical protein
MVPFPFQLDPDFGSQLWQRLNRILSRRSGGDDFSDSLVPSLDHLTRLVQASFWASLEKEETRPVTFSAAFIPPDAGPNAFVFETAVPFSAESLVKIAPAVQASKAHIGIWPDAEGELVIWGFTSAPLVSKSASQPYWFVDSSLGSPLTIQAHEPGQILILASHTAVALITGRRAAFLEEQGRIWETALWSRIPLGVDPIAEHEEQRLQIFQSLFKIAQAARSHGRGGMVLVVPDDEDWRRSVSQPMVYGASAPFERARHCLMQYIGGYDALLNQRGDLVEHILSPENVESIQLLNQSLEAIGQLTAVDGATVLTYGLRVLAFGVKVRPIDAECRPEIVRLSELVEEGGTREVPLSELGNTRHQSAAQFVHDQKGAIAFVISQDQRITLVAWDENLGGITALAHAEWLFS